MSDLVEHLRPVIGKALKSAKVSDRKGIEVIVLEFEDKTVNTEVQFNAKNGSFVSSTTVVIKRDKDKKLKAKEEALQPETPKAKKGQTPKPKARTTEL